MHLAIPSYEHVPGSFVHPHVLCKGRRTPAGPAPAGNRSGFSPRTDAAEQPRNPAGCQNLGWLLYCGPEVRILSLRLDVSNISSVTVAIGQPPIFTSDWAVDRACQPGNSYELPRDFRHWLLIQKFSFHVSKTMSEGRRSATGLPSENEIGITLKFLERDFEDLQRDLEGDISGWCGLSERGF